MLSSPCQSCHISYLIPSPQCSSGLIQGCHMLSSSLMQWCPEQGQELPFSPVTGSPLPPQACGTPAVKSAGHCCSKLYKLPTVPTLSVTPAMNPAACTDALLVLKPGYAFQISHCIPAHSVPHCEAGKGFHSFSEVSSVTWDPELGFSTTQSLAEISVELFFFLSFLCSLFLF